MLNKGPSIPYTPHISTSSRINLLYQKYMRLTSICELCNQYHKQHSIICTGCRKLLARLGHGCKTCMLPLANSQQEYCTECMQNPPHFDKVICTYAFTEPLKYLLHKFKYHNGLYLKALLTELMLDAEIATGHLGHLIPVPISKQRLKERGYNQALLLAKSLSKQINQPVTKDCVYKIKHTENQANISGLARRKNLKRAFKCVRAPGPIVTIIDDILTTGSTANEISKTLKTSGAIHVNIWCIARAEFE